MLYFWDVYRGLIEHGAQAICIHGRTRGSTKNRRCGPADLAAIATIARTLTEEYGGGVPIISNGNITTTEDVFLALSAAHPCSGVMSAEGILANPGLYHNILPHLQSRPGLEVGAVDASNAVQSTVGSVNTAAATSSCAEGKPSLLALYREYCALSTEYADLGGWEQLDRHYRCTHSSAAAAESSSTVTTTYAEVPCLHTGAEVAESVAASTVVGDATKDPADSMNSSGIKRDITSASSTYTPEPRQIYIARQHLTWMLGKSGHGRMVRYAHIGAQYRKHVHLKDALNNAATIDDLLAIAEVCLPN
jgi:tRNA-dihydrouridine synthase